MIIEIGNQYLLAFVLGVVLLIAGVIAIVAVADQVELGLQVAHAVCMCSAFLIVLPSGGFYARFWADKKDPDWFKIHRFLQVFAMICATVGVSFVMVTTEWSLPWNDSTLVGGFHRTFGFIVLIMCLVQVGFAAVRPHAPSEQEEKSTARKVWEGLHSRTGWIIVSSSWVVIVLGLFYGASQDMMAWWEMMVCLAVAVTVMSVWIGLFYLFNRSKVEGTETEKQPLLS